MVTLTVSHLVAMAAGGLVIAAGAFVLAARPQHGLNRLFFLLALADGGSTILFRLSYVIPEEAAYFRGTYWYFFFAFIALLIVFGLRFPVLRARERTTRLLIASVAIGTLALSVAYAWDHAPFWRMTTTPTGVSFPNGPMGNTLTGVFVATLAFLALTLTRDLLRMASPSHRRQSAFIMGGMTLAYAPYATTSLVQGALVDPTKALLTGAPHVLFAYWTFIAYCGILVVSAIRLLRDARPAHAADRRFMLACYVGVVILTLPALVWPTDGALATVRAVAFVFYPALLAYAIVKFEVFDIDKQVRRAATVTIVVGALALVFVLAENIMENTLQDTLFANVGSTWVSGTLAALAVAIVSVPIARLSRKAAGRIVPELTNDELKQRKLDVYRHSLAGALADGLIEERESRTLQALRESLDISPEEHEAALAHVRAMGAAPA